MSAYTVSYSVRYLIPSIQQQIEVAMITAVGNIKTEDPSAPNHANRIAWADWANVNSSTAWIPFGWPVAMNPAIQGSIANDPSGQSVPDSDVQFVVNSNIDEVIADWVADPPEGVVLP
jgi:hypothetical protein